VPTENVVVVVAAAAVVVVDDDVDFVFKSTDSVIKFLIYSQTCVQRPPLGNKICGRC